MSFAPLWAVHISDFVLTPGWELAGFVAAAVLLLIGAWRMDEEILPLTALLAAAFFVASLIHVRVGPSSAHLLLNGLLGVLLGRRAGLAIAAGLFLQAQLIGHGGLRTLGINTCVLTLPALVTWGAFRLLHRHRLSAFLIGVSTFLAMIGLIAGLTLLVRNPIGSSSPLDPTSMFTVLVHPITLVGCSVVALLVALLASRRQVAPEFALGLFLGQLAVMLTLLLQGTVLILGGDTGEANWSSLVAVLFLVHLPIAVIEGTVLGFTVPFLLRVKPQLLGLPLPAPTGEPTCAPVTTS